MVGASFLAIAFHSATLFASDPSSSKYVCVFVWCVCAWYKKREKKRHTQQTCASTRKHIRELGIPVQEKKNENNEVRSHAYAFHVFCNFLLVLINA